MYTQKQHCGVCACQIKQRKYMNIRRRNRLIGRNFFLYEVVFIYFRKYVGLTLTCESSQDSQNFVPTTLPPTKCLSSPNRAVIILSRIHTRGYKALRMCSSKIQRSGAQRSALIAGTRSLTDVSKFLLTLSVWYPILSINMSEDDNQFSNEDRTSNK